MEEAVFRALYKQFMFFSNNGTEVIEHPWFAMSEAGKCCGKRREEIRKALKAFEEHGLVSRIEQEKSTYTMTASGIDLDNVEELINRLTTP